MTAALDTSLTNLVQSVTDAVAKVSDARRAIELLNASELRALKLKTADIERIPQVWLEGRSHPLYRLSDVESYIESKKA